MKNKSIKKLLLSFLVVGSMTGSLTLAQTAPGGGSGKIPSMQKSAEPTLSMQKSAEPDGSQVITLTNRDGIGVNDAITKYIQVGVDQELEIRINDYYADGLGVSYPGVDFLRHEKDFKPANPSPNIITIEQVLVLTGHQIVENDNGHHALLGGPSSYTHIWHFQPKNCGIVPLYIHVERWGGVLSLTNHDVDVCFPIQVVPAADNASQQ